MRVLIKKHEIQLFSSRKIKMRFEVFSFFFFFFVLFGGTSAAGLRKTIRYEYANEFRVAASADVIWPAFADKNLPNLLPQLLPGFFDSIEILEGDGGVGTVLRITYPNGTVPLSNEEKFVTVSDARRLKEVLQTKGGYLDMGVTFYMESFEIIPVARRPNSCIVRSMVKYVVKEEAAPVIIPLISVEALLPLARAIVKNVMDQRKPMMSIMDI